MQVSILILAPIAKNAMNYIDSRIINKLAIKELLAQLHCTSNLIEFDIYW